MKGNQRFWWLVAFALILGFTAGAQAMELTIGGYTSCTAFDEASSCTRAFDNNNVTNWLSTAPSVTRWISVELNETYIVTNIDRLSAYADGHPNQETIIAAYYSLDNTTWSSFATNITGNTLQYRVFNNTGGVLAKFIRIYLNTTPVGQRTANWIGIYGPGRLIINEPANTTYYATNVTYNFTHYQTEAMLCGYWLNGALTWLGNQTNSTAITGTLTPILGQNNFTAFYGNATGGNATATKWFTYTDTYSFRAYDAASTNQITSFTITFWNTTNTTTYNTNTGWLNLSRSGLPTGANVTLEVMASGYRTTNYTRDVNFTGVIYENYPLTFAGINITMYDEATAVPIYATVRIYNATNTLTWGNVLNATQAFNATMPSGAVTVDVSTANSSYYARRYYGALNNNTFYELKAYLLNTSGSTVYVRFHIRDLVGQPIENATVQILRAIGGGASVVVGEMETDASGDAAFYMELGAPYQLQIVATGYLDYYSTLNPSSNDYTITLTTTSGGGATGLPVNVFEDITYYIIPSTALYAEVTNLTLTIYSSNSSLDYFGAAFYNSTGYQLYFVNATGSPNGGVIYYNHNHTNNTGNITMQFWIRRNPGFEGNYTWTWIGGFFNNTAYSLNYTLGQMRTSGASNIGMGVLWLLISLIMGAFVCRVNLFGGAITTIATLAVGAYAGWMSFPTIGGGSTIAATALIAAITFAVFGLLYLRDRI